MRNVKLSTKVIGGFGIILLLMLLVMVIYQTASSKSSNGFTGLLNGDVAVRNHAAEAESFMLQSRRHEKDFLLRHDLKYLDLHAESIAGIIENAQAIQRLESGQDEAEMANTAGKIISLSQAYRKSFEELVAAQERAGLDEKSGLQGKFRDAAHIIGAAMPEHDVDPLLIALLQIRRYEKDFLRSIGDPAKNEKYRGKLTKVIAEYEALLADSHCDPVAKKAQQETLAAYKTATVPWMAAKTDAERATSYEVLRTTSHDMEQAINSVRVSGAKAMLLDIRKHEKDYLLRNDKKYVEKAHLAVEKLRTAFAKAGVGQEHVDATNEQLDIYIKAFDALVAEQDVIDASLATMRDLIHTTEPLLEKLHEAAIEETQISSAEISGQSRSLSQIALIAGLITMLIGMALSFFLSRSITGPIKKTVEWLTSGAEQVSAAAGQVSSSSQVLAEGASEQAAAIEETSASMEEMSSMTRQNADNATQADNLMREALKTIQGTDQSMDEMSRSMEEIASASEQTSKIIKTIDEIAFQTNLLALNAAVEAARAGEAGAGFAVVADEVRNLAMRATEAAKNTADLIEGTVQKVNSGKNIVARTTEAFKEVAENSAKIGSLVGEIATASQEQAKGFTQINQAITQMDSVTQQNSASAEESAAASEELNAQAESMMDVVQDLRSIVDGGARTGVVAVSRALPARKMPQPKLAAPPQPSRPKTKVPAPRVLAAPTAKKAAPKPEDIIPMDDDGDFEDF